MFWYFIVIIKLIYGILFQNFLEFWKNLKVIGPKPLVIFGNLGQFLCGLKHPGIIFSEIYNDYQDFPFVGISRFQTPSLLVRDPKMARRILEDGEKFSTDMGFGDFCVKNKGSDGKLFDFFVHNRAKVDLLKCFINVAEKMRRCMLETQYNDFDAVHLSTKFTQSCILEGILGVDSDMFGDLNSDLENSPIRKCSSKGFGLLLASNLPKLLRILCPTRLLSKRDLRRIKTLGNDNFMKIFNQYCDQTNEDFKTIEEIEKISVYISQIGANMMSYLLFEIAESPNLQKKIREHLLQIKNLNDLNFKDLDKLKYLDDCLEECYRKYSPIPYETRICNDLFEYNSGEDRDFKNLSVKLPKGTPLIIPLLGLNLDPKYITNPNKFMPERYQANKSDLNLPLNDNYKLARYLAKLQIKIGIIYIVTQFNLTPNEKLDYPIKYNPWSFILRPSRPLWLNFTNIPEAQT